MKTPVLRVGSTECGMVGLALSVIWFLGNWQFRDLAAFWFVSGACLFFALASRTRLALAVWTLPAAGFLMSAIVLTLAVQPLRAKTSGGHFENASLPNVLQHLARQKEESPTWDFSIYEEELARKKVTVDLPAGCTLREALDRISQAAGCKYDYSWFKRSRTSSRPTCAKFVLSQPEARGVTWLDAQVRVSRYHIWQMPAQSETNATKQTRR